MPQKTSTRNEQSATSPGSSRATRSCWHNGSVPAFLLLVISLLLGGPLAAQSFSPEDLDRLTRQITEITGFAARQPIPSETISREGWKAWVANEIDEQVKPDEIRAEELTLKMFGLLPRDFDLRSATVDLLAEQAAAVYDHRRKRMLFIDGAASGLMNEMVAIHELAHALADQHFDLTRFIDKAPSTDEAQAARLAVVEGQAMWIMLEAQVSRIGQSLKSDPGIISNFSASAAANASGLFPAFDRAPLYLRQTLMFPYMAGLNFQQKALEHYGQRGFSEVLRRPPATTREVLHPEVWIARTPPVRPPLPAHNFPRGYRKLTSGSVGELDFQIMLTQYTSQPEAEAQAPLWRGGAFDLHEDAQQSRQILRWATVWATGQAAEDFLRLYARVLKGKAPDTVFTRDTSNEIAGHNAAGSFRVTRAGARVQALEGLKPAE